MNNRSKEGAAEMRTSLSDPLSISEIAVPDMRGRIGMTICPGKCGDSVFGDPWKRDLEVDLDAVTAWGAAAVITLLPTREMGELAVPRLGERVQARGMKWLHLPIEDLQAPGPGFDSAWGSIASNVTSDLKHGSKILVHCRGGLGRAGTVAACLLIELGMTPHHAVRQVRAARHRAIETEVQMQYVLRYRPISRRGTRD